MNDVVIQGKCKNVFQSESEEVMSKSFTRLWALVIKNQEHSKLVNVENSILQADIKAI